MFEKFGEFDTAEELNKTAAGLLKEGDTESLLKLAEENGIDKEDVADYIAGDAPEFANAVMCALGKLEVERKDLQEKGVLKDWIEYVRALCTESKEIAVGVRKKGKSLIGCIAAVLKESSKKRTSLDKRICKAAGIPDNVQIPGADTAEIKQIIKEYYTGKQEKK